jgi:2-isopropylmalate synthase
VTTATATIELCDNVLTFTAEGVGPIHALDRALRGCLSSLYPALGAVALTDYRVTVLEATHGSAARVRVDIDWSSGRRKWTTSGTSRNVIEASWTAIADSVSYELEREVPAEELVLDESWAV